MSPIGKPSRNRIGFADLYLERYGSGTVDILPVPDPDLFLVVTIPAYREPDLAGCLNSLLSCDPPGVKWEIIVNINYPEDSPPEVVEISRNSLAAAEEIARGIARDDVRVIFLWNPDMPVRHAGVGLARKIAMDQAISRFNMVNQPDGVLISFDADSICDAGYLKSIARFYLRDYRVRTANIYFEHPLQGESDPRIYDSIAQYELYLRYMRLALEYAGHPHSIHTVGSSFSLRAKTYVRVNGMGRDKAGEDFYFLHKCILQKNFWEINDTKVCPSARESDRVTFGTGASVQKQMNSSTLLQVYDLDSFGPLKDFFGRVDFYWDQMTDHGTFEDEWEEISLGLHEFLLSVNARQRIYEMHRDSGSLDTFRAKFFAWFNGFMVLKYLNETHQNHHDKKPVTAEAARLAMVIGINPEGAERDLLDRFRSYERGRGNRKII